MQSLMKAKSLFVDTLLKPLQSTDSYSLAWGPDTIDKMRGTSLEEVVPQAGRTTGSQ